MISLRLIQGDCLKVLPHIKDNSVNLIFADPPFNKGKDYGELVDDNLSTEEYFSWCEKWISLCFQKLIDTGSIYILNNPVNTSYLKLIMDKYGILRNIIVWILRNPTPVKQQYPKSYLNILFYTKTESYAFDEKAEYIPYEFKTYDTSESSIRRSKHRVYDVWTDIPKLVSGYMAQDEVLLKPLTYSKEHKMQLPEKLLKRIISHSSKPNDLVLDPFVGSGTTMKSAVDLGRNCIGIDIETKSCFLTGKRLGFGFKPLGEISKKFIQYNEEKSGLLEADWKNFSTEQRRMETL